MKICIETIDHNAQRYNTVGDYWVDLAGVVQIRVSNLPDQTYEQLIVLHELIELFLVQARGIPLSKIDEFDVRFEANRKNGNFDEPGDDPKAPYKQEHLIATGIEKILAAQLGVDWKTYDQAVNDL